MVLLTEKFHHLDSPTPKQKKKDRMKERFHQLDSPTPIGRKKDGLMIGGVERIISPVKPRPKPVSVRQVGSESGYEGSSYSSTTGPSNQDEFLTSFVDLLQHFKIQPIPIKNLNKALVKMSRSRYIPIPSHIKAISKSKVSEQTFCLSMPYWFSSRKI